MMRAPPMALAPGARLGLYEIVGPLGAGGMGEVYRAKDTKLGREVALKVLPELFARDPDRLARFEREAQLLASLNHPNIAQIYGIAHDPALALVLELVEGPTLAERIKQGGIPLSEALGIAKQIADALEAAHEQGVIHRDLKPANVKLRADGTVKVLDFGLAKALDPASPTSADAMQSPTMTGRATEMGMILGTAAYMSPEQAKGKAADRRADVWAFGVVLFEMITGEQLFLGETSSEVMASVMKEEPDWTRLPANLPAPVVRLLHRCLEKDPRKRLSAIGDARFDLEETDAGGARSGTPSPSTGGWPASRVALVAAAGLLVGVIATWTLSSALPRSAPSTVVSRSSILPAANSTLFPDAASVAISPDARIVAFVTGDAQGNGMQLWIRRVDGLVARAVDGAEGANQPFWSPDSRTIGFFTKDKLKTVSADGGRVEEVCDVQDARGGAWAANNVLVFAPANAGPLMRVSASGGTPEPATSLDASRGETGHRFPSFLPDGDHFLYAALPARAGTFNVYIGSLSGSKAELLMKAESAPVYASPGYLLFDRKGGLVAQRFDPASRTLSGDPQPLEDVPGGIGAQWFADHAVSASATGALAYLAAPPANTGLVWFDAAGRETGRVEVPPGQYEQVALSRDGRRAVAERRVSPSVADLWMIDLERGGATRFTTGSSVNFAAAWSPDGERVVFSSDRNGPEGLFVKPSNGTGSEQVLYQSPSLFKQPQSWSPDGKYVVYTDNSPITNLDLWVMPMGGGSESKPFVYAQSPANENGGQISPDGHWMAYVSDETGRYEAYVQAFPTPGRKFRLTTAGTSGVWWRKDSKRLLMLNSNSTEVLQSDVQPGQEFSATEPKVIGHLPKGLQAMDVSPDLQRFLGLMIEGGNVNMSVTLVQNWTSALGRPR
jgi:serine/threonine protein kinase/Tol biopolymer transport system component